MTQAGKPATAAASAAVDPIIELVEVVQVRYLVLAALVGITVGIAILYVIGQRMEGTDNSDGSGT
jgi:membrane protein DedA with SNARE-associated domain